MQEKNCCFKNYESSAVYNNASLTIASGVNFSDVIRKLREDDYRYYFSSLTISGLASVIFLPFFHATQYHSHDWFEPAIIFQCPICNQDFFKRRKERMVIA